MTAKKVVVRRTAGAALALVLALVVAGPVAAGKKPPPTTGDKTPPTAPTNLRVTSLGQTSVTLAWNASTDNSGSFTLLRQQGRPGLHSAAGADVVHDRLAERRPDVHLLRDRRRHAASTRPGRATSSRSRRCRTRGSSGPDPLRARARPLAGPADVEPRWRTTPRSSSTYRIFANGAQVTEHLNWYGETEVVLRHLTPSTTYTFTVKALDASGNTSTSNAVTLTTEATNDVTPPSAPTNVRIVGSFGCPEFFVGWTQSTDDTDPQYLIEYEIYVNGVLSPLAVSAGVDEDFVYATASGANTFTVKAVDQAGNTSAASNGVTEFC